MIARRFENCSDEVDAPDDGADRDNPRPSSSDVRCRQAKQQGKDHPGGNCDGARYLENRVGITVLQREGKRELGKEEQPREDLRYALKRNEHSDQQGHKGDRKHRDSNDDKSSSGTQGALHVRWRAQNLKKPR